MKNTVSTASGAQTGNVYFFRKSEWLIALMMEAVKTSETLVNFYQTTRRYNPEDNHLRTHRRENLKSYSERWEV
jgi:hypothetical protein